MNGLPLHPMLVHFPLALAAFLPLLAILALGAHLMRRQSRGLFVAVVAVQLVLALGAMAAQRTGQAEEERAEEVVPHSAIETHEEAAEAFIVAAWIAAAVSLVPALWTTHRGIATAGAAATVVAALVLLFLGYRVGEAGAELVYRHGAASAYVGAGDHPPARLPRGEDDDDDD